MRTDNLFLIAYRKALRGTDPSARDLSGAEDRALGLTELCLHFLARHLPKEDVSALPYLLLGYSEVMAAAADGRFLRDLAALRHLAGRYVSASAWLDACRQHALTSETLRCYAIQDRIPTLRRGAPEGVLSVLEEHLATPAPWVTRTLQVAAPGEALVRTNRGETLLAYQIPPRDEDAPAVPEHALPKRRVHAPITLTLAQLQATADAVDAREARADWPATLPPLRLKDRLRKLKLKGLKDGFFDGETLTLDGAVHVLGMLSSGKSTLVWLIVMALTIGGQGKRIAVLVSDTIQGATFVARLRRHRVDATVLSSFYNRERHLNSIHWQQGLSANGWSVASLGDVAENFSVACPLDGLQREPAVVRGASRRPAFPNFKEKPCHRLYQRRSDAERVDDATVDDDADDTVNRSCPLWAQCPAQEQQRSAVTAQVIALTPQAFVHMTPDKWTADRHLTLPELFQYSMDLVIVDEVDSVQKTLDDIFAPRSPIMGDERDVYAPAIGAKSSEALRERSGVQFRRQVNARWQANFHTFYRLIGTLYALLQNEQAHLADFYRNSPFTAGGILYEIWRRQQDVRGLARPGRSFDDPDLEEEFLEVIKVASGISRFSIGSAISRESTDEHAEEAAQAFRKPAFQQASDALQAIARDMIVSDYYDDLAERVAAQLDGPLSAFDATGPAASHAAMTPRANALALLLAVVTDLVLTHYYWLVKTQPAVATDLGIDDAQLLSQANNLIRHYRTLLPSNPAGAVFGLLYDEPGEDRRETMGGKLTLINHLGVGRHLITHLHDLLAAEGQAGPHVLMLSGTSWAGGSERQRNPRTGKPMDCASPSFDVQVPAQGVLLQPEAELDAINKSIFELVSMRDEEGRQVRVSGLRETDRRKSLSGIARRLAARRDNVNMIEDNWLRMDREWGWEQLAGRRRALLVTNSYADAAIVADILLESLEAHGYADWRVFGLTRDRADDGAAPDEQRLRRARALPRSLIERFGEEPEKSILVAPMQVVARGHNILNTDSRAAIASIYFLHRPHPRPDDLASVIGRLNRYAVERFDRGMRDDPEHPEERLSQRARRMRYAATNIVRYSLYSRSGYSGLSTEYKAQFAWDMLTPLWQTIGRGIRNGCPVHIGFVDRQFAPLSFDGARDSADSSVLVQALRQLDVAMAASDPAVRSIAELLYRPFRDALSLTRGLAYG
ncbi:MAG: hypothetical protein JWR80_2689 [Bradyrhizobium sp.]|nr:hypothetical protein [Bradyrhizobium sp.]